MPEKGKSHDDSNLSGDYARDTHREGYGDDYARESHAPGSAARGDLYGGLHPGDGDDSQNRIAPTDREKHVGKASE